MDDEDKAKYFKKLDKDMDWLSDKYDKHIEKYEKFGLLLITLSAGTISIFSAFSQGGNIAFVMKIGFLFLAISLVAGLFALYINTDLSELGTFLMQEYILEGKKEQLSNLHSIDKELIEHIGWLDKGLKDVKDNIKSIYNYKNKPLYLFLKKIHLSTDLLSSMQLIFFFTGIIILCLGILFKSS